MTQSSTDSLVERLRDYAGDDHERLCQGRNYDCTCGYDARRDPLIAAAADELTALTAKVARMGDALKSIIDMNVQYAIDKYGDAQRAEAMACVVAARSALQSEKDREGEDGR
jgi:hypothetical protein